MDLPSTRYYGSKRKLVENIWSALDGLHLEYESVLDLFGGTGILSYYMALQNKNVIYNDIMAFNCEIAKALLCSPKGIFTEADAHDLLREDVEYDYLHHVRDLYAGVYYTQDENYAIDIFIQNINRLPEEQRSSAYYILFQSCLIKRPFNIFHRRNLNLRENHVKSRFGNKTTWEKSFEVLFSQFTKELNRYQFEQLPNVQISNQSALNLDMHADLVYIDTPYFSKNSTSISYHNRYHFLEGLMHYADIPDHVNYAKANREMDFGRCREFENKLTYLDDLHQLLNRHRDSIIALSYTTNGYPSKEELRDAMAQHKEHAQVIDLGEHSFALNKDNSERHEVLVVGY